MPIAEKSTKKPKISAAEKRKIENEKRRAESAEYLLTKKHILEKEEKNYAKLAFIRDKNGWYKGFEHTAVIFAHDLAPKIGMKVRLLEDRDYNHPAKIGMVTFQNMEKATALLSGIGIKKEYDKDGTVVFRLVDKYFEDDIQRMLEDEKTIYDKANQLVLPKEVMPALKNRLQVLARSVFEAVRKMPAPARDAFGIHMAQEAGGLVREFFMVAVGDIEKAEYFKRAHNSLGSINGDLMLLLNIGALSPKKVMRMMEFLNSARTQLEAEVKKK